MDETNATATKQPDTQPPRATGETLVLSVTDAAEVLGISPQAVRKRIAKGTLPARRDGRVWSVFLDRATSETDAPATAQPSTHPRAHPIATTAHPQAVQLAALVEPFTTPLVARIEALSREAERERGRADDAEHERDRLRGEVTRLTAGGEAPVTRSDALGRTEPGRPVSDILVRGWRRWWRRLTG